jgi:putative ABC transport system ATP-binding protein
VSWKLEDSAPLARVIEAINQRIKRRELTMGSATADNTLQRTDLAARAVDLVKVFGEGQTAVRALDGVSVDFPSGRFTAIMGPSGSGKSTFMHCLAGLDTVTSGQVYIGGTELGSLSDKQLTLLRRERIGFIFQAYNLLPTLTAAENIELPMALAGSKPDRGWIDKVIDAVGLRDRLSHRPSELSGGQQQRVAAARALASTPSIVFADEPTGNLDSNASAELLAFLRRSVDEFGQTIVMVTHDPGAASFADHVVFLQDGRVVDEMPNPTPDKVLDLMKKLGG